MCGYGRNRGGDMRWFNFGKHWVTLWQNLAFAQSSCQCLERPGWRVVGSRWLASQCLGHWRWVARADLPAVPSASQPAPASAYRDPHAAGGAVQVLGAAVGVEAAAAPGPPGVFPPESRDRARVFPQPGEAGRALLLQDPQLPGAPVQVRRGSGSGAVGGSAGRWSSKETRIPWGQMVGF